MIREATREDYPRIVELRNLTENEPITVDDLVRRDEEGSQRDFLKRLVTEEDSVVSATGQVFRSIWHPPGLFRVMAWVEPQARGRGLGSALISSLEELARERGCSRLEMSVPDSSEGPSAFAGSLGFARVAHTFESVLNLRAFDPGPFSHWAELPDVSFFTMADTGMSVDAKSRLWELNTETSRDEPHNDPDYAPPFDDFAESVIAASWFDPRGQFVGEIDGQWVAMSAVGEVHHGSQMNLFTGVRREFRGRGLAKAAKFHATLYALSTGATHIRTNNDSRNMPMLAINRALGYQPEPGWFITRKTL